MPLAGGMDFWGASVPNSSFAFPIGQAISRATLFAIMSTTYGVGDGSTTFNLPDKTGRVSAVKEASATRLSSSGFGGNSTLLGAVGGADKETLAQANLPNVNFIGATTTGTVVLSSTAAFVSVQTTGGSLGLKAANGSVANAAVSVASGGSGTALVTTQPTIVCNYIIRII
jgi:microcystin-dependent protein